MGSYQVLGAADLLRQPAGLERVLLVQLVAVDLMRRPRLGLNLCVERSQSVVLGRKRHKGHALRFPRGVRRDGEALNLALEPLEDARAHDLLQLLQLERVEAHVHLR